MRKLLVVVALCSMGLAQIAKADPETRYLWKAAMKEQHCKQNPECQNLKVIAQKLAIAEDVLKERERILNLQCESNPVRIAERLSDSEVTSYSIKTPCSKLVPNYTNNINAIEAELVNVRMNAEEVDQQLEQIYQE